MPGSLKPVVQESGTLKRKQPITLTDTLHRPLRDLRISVTDRCNFRCPLSFLNIHL